MSLRRILAPVYMLVPDRAVDPGWGIDMPVDPGYGRPGWSPADPGYDIPGFAPVRPGQGLPGTGGHPWLPGLGRPDRPDQGLPIHGHPGNKPPGRPVLPNRPENGLPPSIPPSPWGGWWEIIDPGFGHAPILGFFPIDPGFGHPETPPPTPGTPLPKPPGGNWVPTDPDYGKPERPCGGAGIPHPPLWAWIPDPPDWSKPVPEPVPEPK